MNRKPFFARYLEAQELESVAGGKPYYTMKHPSDDDEGEIMKKVTLKYPSDGDDAVTCKYPSDDDEGGEPM